MNLKELHSFKLSDAVTFHDKLNPKLWIGVVLRPEVREQLMTIAQDFLEELGVHDLDVKDITISGSNAAYSYTKHSDLDLHILVDMGNLPVDEVYKELFTAKKTIYNDTHDIKIHGIPVELYVQDSRQPVVSLGEYSILNDKWLKIPSKRRSNFDQTSTKSKYEKLLSLIEMALQSKKYSKVKHIIDTIKRYRQAGLDKGGEFGPENLAYKMLRSQGYITKLYDLRDKLHSEKLSFETMYQNIDEELEHIPTVLYHATYKQRLKNIKLTGLGAGKKRNWTDSRQGVVYLALDPHVAESYAETALDDLDADWDIVILQVSTNGLDSNKFHLDSNVQDNEGDTVEYHGIIPPSNISLYKQGVAESSNNESPDHLVSEFLKSISPKELRYYTIRDNCGPAALHMKDWAEGKGIDLTRHEGYFVADTVVYDKADFTKEMKREFIEQGLDFNDPTARKQFIESNPKYSEEWKKIPHYWLQDKQGNIYDPTGYIQFVKTGLSSDLDKSRYKPIRQGVAEEYNTMQFAAEKTPAINPYGGRKDNQYRGGISEAADMDFEEGDCPIFAIALHRLSKLPLMALVEYDEELGSTVLIHAYVKLDDRWRLDITGETDVDWMLQKYPNNGNAEEIEIGEKDLLELGYGKSKCPTLQQVLPHAKEVLQNINEASGYIPSEKQKNDPRFKTALTVDVHPDTIKKNAKAFYWNTSRAGIPPTAKANGKIS
jgi:hypothetical protein